jgi:adenylate cyclase
MGAEFDPEAEGLLEGAEGEDRERLRALLVRLHDGGAQTAELREALAGGRLPLLTAERVLAGGERYSANEIAERVGVPLEVLDANWGALGMVVTDPDQRDRTKADLEAAERMRELLDAGIEADAVEESTRVMSMALAQIAASHREMVAELVLTREDSDGSGERGIGDEIAEAERLEAVTKALVPLIGPALEHLYTLQLREQLRHAVIDFEGRRSGRPAGVDETAVAFADLVDFTKLGEQLAPEEFGEITRRFSRLASDAAGGPVRLVKMIGDAAMFASPEPAVLAQAVLGLLELVEQQDGGFPGVRAGMGWGAAVARGGDLYGRPVNLASRLTGVARPGSLLVAGDGIEALEQDDGLRLSDAGHKRLKGIEGALHIYRVRRAPGDDDEAAADSKGDEQAAAGRETSDNHADHNRAGDGDGEPGGEDDALSDERRGSRRRRSRRS